MLVLIKLQLLMLRPRLQVLLLLLLLLLLLAQVASFAAASRILKALHVSLVEQWSKKQIS